jgi:hypothetical protein
MLQWSWKGEAISIHYKYLVKIFTSTGGRFPFDRHILQFNRHLNIDCLQNNFYLQLFRETSFGEGESYSPGWASWVSFFLLRPEFSLANASKHRICRCRRLLNIF